MVQTVSFTSLLPVTLKYLLISDIVFTINCVILRDSKMIRLPMADEKNGNSHLFIEDRERCTFISIP